MENGVSEEKKSMVPIENENEKKDTLPDNIELKSWFGVRHAQMIFPFFLIGIAYGMRVNMSVGIVAMTDPRINPDFPIYNWTMKSTILSSFFWGYAIPQIGAGQMAEKFGAKWIFFIAMGLSSIFTILIPHMAKLGVWGVMTCRVLQGFTQGFFYPTMHDFLSRWIPLSERSRMGTFVYAGGPLGTVIALPITGWIAASSFGWPSAFYLYGLIGLAWTFLWLWKGSGDPSEHKTISKEEKMYIQKSQGNKSKSEKSSTPWLHILTSLPFYSILVAHCGHAYGFTALMTQIPRYMNSILHFNIKDNGLLSAAPYLALWILSFFFSYMTDYTINKKIFSVGVARKIVTFIGSIGPALSLFCLALADNNQRVLIIILLISAVGIKSATFCGFQVNHIDIAPSHAGTLMGITNSCAHMFSILSPLTVEFLVTDETDSSQWKTVFFITSGVYLGCSIMFTIFGQGSIQSWDKLSISVEEVALKEKDEDMKETEKNNPS